jgi:hypothetical protein
MPEHKQMTSAYQEAAKRLRKKYDAEFHSILEQVYEENGMVVKKRMSHAQKQARRIEEAKALLASQDASS